MKRKKYSELTEIEKIESNFTWTGVFLGCIIIMLVYIIFLLLKFIVIGE